MTAGEIEDSLQRQILLHDILTRIINAIAELDPNDDQGREWILEQLNDE